MFSIKNFEIIKVNDACENIIGKPCRDAVNKKILIFITDDDSDKFIETVKRINTEDYAESIEVKIKTDMDSVKHTEWNISRYGEYFYAIVRDNTEKHIHAERKIKMEKQILQTQKA